MAIRAKPGEVARRKDVCRSCPNAERAGKKQILVRCRKCGCPIAFLTAFQGAKCPAGHW